MEATDIIGSVEASNFVSLFPISTQHHCFVRNCSLCPFRIFTCLAVWPVFIGPKCYSSLLLLVQFIGLVRMPSNSIIMEMCKIVYIIPI